MPMRRRTAVAGAIAVLAAGALLFGGIRATLRARYNDIGYAMSTVVTQTACGPSAKEGMRAVGTCLTELENRFSLYRTDSEIAAVNAAAGQNAVPVSAETFALLQRTLALSEQSDGAFRITVAPLTQLWGITGEAPRVPTAEQLAAVLPLIDDKTVQLNEASFRVMLPRRGQALDLGGIAKGYACDAARQVYLQHGVRHALLSVGGNICAVGGNADGTPYRIGFRDPDGGAESYLASFLLTDGVVSVSGGYERWFEQDGVRYHHILDPATGFPAESDLVSVGVVSFLRPEDAVPDGTAADFWSTTLFCWGKEKTLDWMRQTGAAVLALDKDGTLYVSACLRDGFRTVSDELPVVFIG